MMLGLGASFFFVEAGFMVNAYATFFFLRVARERIAELFDHKVPVGELAASKKANSKYKVSVEGEKLQIDLGKGTYTVVDKPDHPNGRVEMPGGKQWTLVNPDGTRVDFHFPHAHVHVMRRIDDRCPGSGPAIGERVWYVYAQAPPNGSLLQYEQAEDLQYALQDPTFKADVVYYYEHCVKNALESIFEIFTAQPAKLFEDLLRCARNKRAGQREIGAFFAVKA